MNDPSRRRRSRLVIAAVLVVVLLAGAFTVRHFLVQPFSVPSASMAPTLRSGDVILVDRGTRGTADRGDIVVVDGRSYFGPAEDGGRYWVKRVIGIGGDRVQCCTDDGRLLRNGEALDEPYLQPDDGSAGGFEFDLAVPDGRLFLLGDNRSDSTDSRSFLGSPGGGMVPAERVVGEAHRIIWPLDRAGQPVPIGSAR